MRFGNTTEIEARVTTLRSPANQNYEISFVTTVKGVYIALTSDIVMKGGVPYINGSDVALEPVQTGDTLSSGVLDFRPTTKAGVVGSTPDCRVGAGEYTIEDSVSLEELVAAEDPEKYLRPVDSMFRNYPSVTLTENQEKRCRNGNAFSVKLAEGTYRAYSREEEFLMLAKVENGIMSTIKSFWEV